MVSEVAKTLTDHHRYPESVELVLCHQLTNSLIMVTAAYCSLRSPPLPARPNKQAAEHKTVAATEQGRDAS